MGRMDWSGSVEGQKPGSCERCNESSGSVNAVKLLASRGTVSFSRSTLLRCVSLP